MQLQPLAIVCDAELFQRFDVAIGYGDDLFICILLEVHEHRALEHSLVHNHPSWSAQAPQVFASKAVMNVNNQVISLIFDFLLERPETIKTPACIKLVRVVQILIRFHKLRVLGPGHIVDLSHWKPCTQNSQHRRRENDVPDGTKSDDECFSRCLHHVQNST